jgi:curli biogenesis system outer membrane secretion channel CsgG
MKLKMKSALLVAGILALGLTVTACASSAPASGSSAPAAPAPASKNAAPAPAPAATPLDGTIEKSYGLLSERFTDGVRIAILPVYSKTADEGLYIYENLTLHFVNSLRYDMLERQQVETLLKEQDFQMSGLVDDKTAVDFAKLMGARFIIVGAVQGEGTMKRLVFRALDVQTGKIIGMVSERIN